MREDGGDREAAGALDIHEERVGVLYQSLELVLARLRLGGRVKEIDSESLQERRNALALAHSSNAEVVCVWLC